MINIGLYITTLGEPKLFLTKGIDRLISSIKKEHREVNRLFDACRVNRIYVGSEYCWRLLPSKADISFYLYTLLKHHIEITFVTPVVFMKEYGFIRDILSYINNLARNRNKKIEVVVNDWGMLWLISKTFNFIEPVLGRLMSKIKRDPRFLLSQDKNFSKVIKTLRQSSMTVKNYRKFLLSLGVRRAEFDWPEQGLEMNFSRLGIKASLYFPHIFITSGRRCLSSLISKPLWQKCIIEPGCSKECRRQGFYMSCADTSNYLFRDDNNFIQVKRPDAVVVGKAVFSETPNWKNITISNLEKQGISRIIYTFDI